MTNIGLINNDHYKALYRLGGSLTGELNYSTQALSFWGGVNPVSGEIIDRHHPLSGHIISGKILAIPSGRGSCTGSALLLELLMNGKAPSGLILSESDEILILGAMVAQLFFGLSIPIAVISKNDFKALSTATFISFHGKDVLASKKTFSPHIALHQNQQESEEKISHLNLSDNDRQMLEGQHGKSQQLAMQLICQMAELQKANKLINVTQVHVDGCIYTGHASLKFASMLNDAGARVSVPTTLNSISIDRQNCKYQGLQQEIVQNATALADSYVKMGAQPTYTCAPYLLPSAPQMGENIGWAESNAVIFANSILGAHTQKYPDFLDICIAITGKAPEAGCHKAEERIPILRFDISITGEVDDSFYPLLGYAIGEKTAHSIPLICLPENFKPNRDDLKAFGAAFATMSSAPMFHIDKITPESKLQPQWQFQCKNSYSINEKELANVWYKLNPNRTETIDLVALGNPHFSLEEASKLAKLCKGKIKHNSVDFIVTLGREIFSKFKNTEQYRILTSFGIQFITDTCWCMLQKPPIRKTVKTIITNSGKYAHYGAGLTGCEIRFGSMLDCVSAAISGQYSKNPQKWLVPNNSRENNHA